MGRSKFPGKPSSSVMNDRIRVLNKNESDRILNKRNSKNCPSCNNSFNTNIKPTSEGINDDKIKPIKKKCSSALEQNQETPISFTGNSNAALKSSPSLSQHAANTFATQKNNRFKKKSVTFKNIPESSDDILISRNIHNPVNKGPLVSIMKKNCIKSQRYMPQKDRIVRPSRLTKILKNNANIDKTKFLSFRSVHLPVSHDYKKILDEQELNDKACKLFLTGEEEKKHEHKLITQIEDVENFEQMTSENRYSQLMDKWKMPKSESYKELFEIRDQNTNNGVPKQPSKKRDISNHSQIILRQPRLLFENQDEVSDKSKQHCTVSIFSPTKMCNNSVCGVCSTTVNYTNIQDSRRYGITACEFCRTFISKISKKTVPAIPNSSKAFKIQCVKKEGECLIRSSSNNNFKSFKKIYNERCSACWLKKCIKSFHFPLGHKLRLSSLISKAPKTQQSLHFKNAINKLNEQINIHSQQNLFGWKQTISANFINESTKSYKEQSASNDNFIDNLVNGNIKSEMLHKDGRINKRQNFTQNKTSRKIPKKTVEFRSSSITTFDYPKRQKIEFKGPRVKHVCRSASIALGQQVATFSNDDGQTLRVLQCSSENEDISIISLASQMASEVEQIQEEPAKELICVENIENNVFQKALLINRSSFKNVFKVDEKIKKSETKSKPVCTVNNNYEKLAHKCGDSSTLFSPRYGNKSALSKRNFIRLKPVPRCENKSKMISIDFWDTYVPDEVNRTGFGIILTKPTSILALCFLCGSMDLNCLVFCVFCCEPYHTYCIKEAYSDGSEFIYNTEASSKFLNQLNWMCPRCTVCDSCNMSSGVKIKCQKCKKNYHNTCMGTSKGLLGADRPLICRNCLKCQFCSTTKVSKYVGNQPTCIQCIMERRSVSTCSLCQKCIDSVSEAIILNCGVCNELMHAKCEGLTEEQTNLLSCISGSTKFVCNKCSLTNNKSKSLAKEWRDAVYKELNSRFLQVLKLLSKSRLADILKKSIKNNCICGFDKIYKNLRTKKDSNNCFTYRNSIIGSRLQSECLCSIRNFPQKLNILDIKKKIANGEYVSLSDFNADMNDVIIPLKNDELILTYKEIISETFSWFQNETKTCTDALEEDMFDSCNYSVHTDNIITEDQNVQKKLPLPRSEKKVLTPLKLNMDKRICVFCLKAGDDEMLQKSRLLYYGYDSWVHVNCALWSINVYEEFDGSLQNVHSAFIRGKLIRCVVCGNSGATIKCTVKTCCNYYHFQCARKADCVFSYETSFFCSVHSSGYDKTNNNISKEFLSTSRPLHIECNKSHKKYVESFKVQFMLGSLAVTQLGTLFLPFSDTSEAIIPINFTCTRLYWSSKEPWKIIKYKVRTSIHNSILNMKNESERNFTVDHSKNNFLVEKVLSQISCWHNKLTLDEVCLNNEHSCLNNLKFSTNAEYRNENPVDTFTEEPQNNSDLLSPEIEEAILEDLPKNILDGISMLDIFPKLIIHEDLEYTERKQEKNNDLAESNVSQERIDCLLLNSIKNQDSKLCSQKPERLNINSEFAFKNVDKYRSKQRSSDNPYAIDNRRLINDTSALNLNFNKYGEKVDDSMFNSKNSIFSEENKNLALFMREHIKLMQLDGADDHTSGFLSTKIHNRYSKTPVKCDRCHCTYRSFDYFEKHFINCEQISTNECENETSSMAPSCGSFVIVNNKDSINLYQTEFLRNQNVSTNVKPANFQTVSPEAIPQNFANTANLYVHYNNSDYNSSNIDNVNVNTLNYCNFIQENNSYKKSNISNSPTKSQQYKLIANIKEDAFVTPAKPIETPMYSQDKNNYLQLLNQNLVFSEQCSQKEQQYPRHQQFVIVQQSTVNSQPMLIHQVPNAPETMLQNIFPVQFPNNSYASVPAFTNSLLPAPLWHSDYNVILSSGLQMLPVPSLQLVSPSPQFVGSCNVPQVLQLESNQALVGGTSTLDLMQNGNHLLLVPQQPMFYELETIVQNTVMSSQQFVSTAIQGVLNQNASFSATTTQVFQSSKLEPICDSSAAYIVLNNVDGTSIFVPQTNILPGYMNSNSSQDLKSGSSPDVERLNGPHPHTIIQQSDHSKIFPLIQTLPETPNNVDKVSRNELPEKMNFETISNILPPIKRIAESTPIFDNSLQTKSKNLLSHKWLGNGSPMKKLESSITSVSKIESRLRNGHNFSNGNSDDFLEVQNTRPEIHETITKHKIAITPRSIKRKNSSTTLSQINFKIIQDDILQKDIKVNQRQDIFLEKPNIETDKYCELLSESTLEGTDLFVSSIRKNNNTHSTVKNELKTSTDLCGIPEPIKSEPGNSLLSIVNRSQLRKSVNLKSKKLFFPTPSLGSSLNNVPTNVVVPIMQANQIKNTISRPTNRVLPMQSIHTPGQTLKPNNRCISKENVQSSEQCNAEILKTIVTAKYSEYIKPIEDVSEAEKSSCITDSSKNVTAKENLSAKIFTEHNPITLIKDLDKNIMHNKIPVDNEIIFDSFICEKTKIESSNCGKNENPLDNQIFLREEKTVNNFDPFEAVPTSAHILFPASNAKIDEDIQLKKENHDTHQILKDKDIAEIKLSKPSDHEYIFHNNLENYNKTFKGFNFPLTQIPKKFEVDEPSVIFPPKQQLKVETNKNSTEPYLIFEVQSEDGFSYKSQSISDLWEKVFQAVQSARRAHGLPSYPIESFAEICGVQILGLKTNALKYLIEQLPGTEKCQRYSPKYHGNESTPVGSMYTTNNVRFNSNKSTAARCGPFTNRSAYDMFNWLASKHREQPKQIFVQPSDTELIARRCTANLPMAMKYRTLKETCKLNVGVFRSLIHGRGLFCIKDMEAGEMVIEYAGELIRSTLADKRERFYDNKGIGCYMFKIDEHFVVDATMRGNAARFINHSCEPNCYSKVLDILGHKHIIIFSLRRIVQGEELTYDYKFPFEDVKIHCYCASKKCRKYLN